MTSPPEIDGRLVIGFTPLIVDPDDTGTQGPKGDQGAKGDTGPTPVFTMGTVTTLPADQVASASITGTVSNPILNLQIPQGEQGIDGSGSTSVDDIAPVHGSVPLLTTPGGRSKVWTPRQFGWTGSGNADSVFASMIASGEQHFDLGAEVYNIEGTITFGEGINLDGRGGKGKGLDRGATCFVLQDSTAQVHLRSAGFGAERFMIDANNIAVNPLYIGGTGTGDVGAQPNLRGICVMQAAAGGAAVTVDGTQNMRSFDLTLLNNAGKGLELINHAGGNDFYGTEITGSGSYNVHGNNAGHNGFYGGTLERNTSPSDPDVLINGVVWFPSWYWVNVTFAEGGAAAPSARHIFEHRATGAVILHACDFAGTTNDIAVACLGTPDTTSPLMMIGGLPYFTGAGMLAFAEVDSRGEIYCMDDIRGQVAPYGPVPLLTGGSDSTKLARISRGTEYIIGGGISADGDVSAARHLDTTTVITLVADGAVNLDLSKGHEFAIHKGGHVITGLTTSNGVDGQRFTVGILEQTTVTNDTLPGSGSSPPWEWIGGDSNKPHTPIVGDVVWSQLEVISGTYYERTRGSRFGGADQPRMFPTSVKTGTYTALWNQIVPCDASSAGFTVNLTATPADCARITVKKIDTSLNAVTIACGGSDVFNKAGGATTLTLSYQFQSVTLQYAASSGIWYVIAADVGNDPRLARSGNFDVVSGGIVLPANLATTSTVALIAGNSGIATWAPVDLVPGKSYDALVAAVVTTAQVGGTTTTTLALYADKNGQPDVVAGPVASQTVVLTSTGNRIGVLGSPYVATATRYWVGALYVESVAPSPRATLATISVGLCVGHDGSSTIGVNSWRGWTATGLAAMPTGATTLTGTATPYLVGVRAA